MTTKTIIITIPQLCTKLSINQSINLIFIRAGSLWIDGGIDSYGQSFSRKILSVGDKIEMDECLNCKHSKSQHNAPTEIDMEWNCEGDSPELGKGNCTCIEFYKTFATVKSIKLVERCCKVCGKTPHEYMGLHNYETVAEQMMELEVE